MHKTGQLTGLIAARRRGETVLRFQLTIRENIHMLMTDRSVINIDWWSVFPE